MYFPSYEYTGYGVSTTVSLLAKNVADPIVGRDGIDFKIHDDVKKWLDTQTYWTYKVEAADSRLPSGQRFIHNIRIDFFILNSETAVMFKLTFGGQ